MPGDARRSTAQISMIKTGACLSVGELCFKALPFIRFSDMQECAKCRIIRFLCAYCNYSNQFISGVYRFILPATLLRFEHIYDKLKTEFRHKDGQKRTSQKYFCDGIKLRKHRWKSGKAQQIV